MDIQEFCERFYEDLNGRIVAVNQAGADIAVDLTCQSWSGSGEWRLFRFMASEPAECNVRIGHTGLVMFTPDHILTFDHNSPHFDLYYSTSPNNPHEVLGVLWETHERVCGGWRPLAKYVNASPEELRQGNGLLARGPEPIIEQYKAAIARHMRVYSLPSYVPKGGYQALVFDASFLICRAVAVEEMEVPAPKTA